MEPNSYDLNDPEYRAKLQSRVNVKRQLEGSLGMPRKLLDEDFEGVTRYLGLSGDPEADIQTVSSASEELKERAQRFRRRESIGGAVRRLRDYPALTFEGMGKGGYSMVAGTSSAMADVLREVNAGSAQVGLRMDAQRAAAIAKHEQKSQELFDLFYGGETQEIRDRVAAENKAKSQRYISQLEGIVDTIKAKETEGRLGREIGQLEQISDVARDIRDKYGDYDFISEESRQEIGGKVASAVGEMAPLTLSLMTPATAGGAFGQIYEGIREPERILAEANGADFDALANLDGRLAVTLANVAVERLLGVETALQKALARTGKDSAKALTIREIATTVPKRVIPSMAGEGAEEMVQGTIEDVFRVTQYDPEYDMSLEAFVERRGEEFIVGALAGGVLAGGIATAETTELTKRNMAFRKHLDPEKGATQLNFNALKGKSEREVIQAVKENGGNRVAAVNAVKALRGDENARKEYVDSYYLKDEELTTAEAALSPEDLAMVSTELEMEQDEMRRQEQLDRMEAERTAFETDEQIRTEALSEAVELFDALDDGVQIDQDDARVVTFMDRIQQVADERGMNEAQRDAYVTEQLSIVASNRGISLEEARDKVSSLVVRGETSTTGEFIDDVVQIQIQLNQGATLDTIYEERGHAEYRKLQAAMNTPENPKAAYEAVLGWKKQVEEMTGEKTHGDSEADVDEWIARKGVAWAIKNHQDEAAMGKLSDGIRKWIERFVEKLKTAAAILVKKDIGLLSRMKAEGTLDPAMESFLNRAAGLERPATAAEREQQSILDEDVSFQVADLSEEQAGKILEGATYIAPEDVWQERIDGPVVIGAYHGSTHTIERFTDERSNRESDMGVGIYATTSPEDASENYAGEGPDLTQRVETRTERLADNIQDQFDERGRQEVLDSLYRSQGDLLFASARLSDMDDVDAAYEVAKYFAKRELVGEGGRIYPVYLPMKNPAVLGGDGETFYDPREKMDMSLAEDYRDAAEEEILDEYGAEPDEVADYEDEIRQRMVELAEADGVLENPLLLAVQEVASRYEGVDQGEIISDLDEIIYEGATLRHIEERLRESNGLFGMMDFEEGGSGEFIHQLFQELGYDGIIDRTVDRKFGSTRQLGTGMEGMNAETVHIILPVNTANRPISAISPRISFQVAENARDEAFYSQLERTLSQKLQGRSASVQQVKGLLSPKHGIKPEEVKWSGIEQWLEDNAENGKIQTADLMEYLRDAGRVKFEEVQRRDDQQFSWASDELFYGEQSTGLFIVSRDDRGYDIVDSDGEPTNVEPIASYEEAQEEAEVDAQGMIDDAETAEDLGAPQYDSYQLPNGKNYREVVLTMPPEFSKAAREAKRITSKYGLKYAESSKRRLRDAGATPEEIQTYEKATDAASYGAYASSHFTGIPNYVAHMRLNERQDSEGNEGLFIEEIQSDRHQEGRGKGYKEDMVITDEEFDAAGDAFRKQLLIEDYLGFDRAADAMAAVASAVDWVSRWDVQNEKTIETGENWKKLYNLRRRSSSAIPDAPYRKEWPLAMFKRALRDAVASGKDWIGWTTGETQAERYDLSKQVDAIIYSKNSDGTFYVAAEKDGDIPMIEERVPAEKLTDMVGKEVAQKIVDGDGKKTKGGDFRLEGENLKVGGEGMKGFYDNMLPKAVQKYVKKWGGKVEMGKIDVSGGKPTDYADFDAYMNAKDQPRSIHKVTITDAMRESVAKGQPSFQVDEAVDPEDPSTESGTDGGDLPITVLEPSEDEPDINWDARKDDPSFQVDVDRTAFPIIDEEMRKQIMSETDTIGIVHIDRMKAGGDWDGVPLQGGMFYPAIKENLENGIVWAFNSLGAANDIIKRARANNGYLALTIMAEGNIVGNKTFGNIWFNELEKAIADKKTSKTKALAFLNEIRKRAAGKFDTDQKNKKRKAEAKGKSYTVKKFVHPKNWKTIEEARNDIISMPQIARGKYYFSRKTVTTNERGTHTKYENLLTLSNTEQLGIPSAETLVPQLEEGAFSGMKKDSMVAVIYVDPDQFATTAEEAGVTPHLSYGFVVRGRPIGKLQKPVVLTERYPEFEGRMMSAAQAQVPGQEAASFQVEEETDSDRQRELDRIANELAQEEKRRLEQIKKLHEQGEDVTAKLEQLDQLRKTLPTSIRSRLGGDVQIARRKTREGRQNELNRRIQRAVDLEERYEAMRRKAWLRRTLNRFGHRGKKAQQQSNELTARVRDILRVAAYASNSDTEERVKRAVPKTDQMTDIEYETTIEDFLGLLSPSNKNAGKIGAAFYAVSDLIRSGKYERAEFKENRKREAEERAEKGVEVVTRGTNKVRDPQEATTEGLKKGKLDLAMQNLKFYFFDAFNGMQQHVNLLDGKRGGYFEQTIFLPVQEAKEREATLEREHLEATMNDLNEIVGTNNRKAATWFKEAEKPQQTDINWDAGHGMSKGGREMSIMQGVDMLNQWGDLSLRPTFEEMGINLFTIQKVRDFVGPEGVALSDYLRERYKMIGEDIRQRHMEVEGFPLDLVEGYGGPVSRIDVEKVDESSAFDYDSKSGRATVKNGSFKARTENTKAIAFGDATKKFLRHMQEAHHYISHAEVAHLLTSTLGQDSVESKKLRRAIEQRFDRTLTRAIDENIDRIIGGTFTEAQKMWSLLDKTRGQLTKGTLALKPDILIKQLTSAPAFTEDIGPVAYAKAMTGMMKGGDPFKWVKMVYSTNYVKNRLSNSQFADIQDQINMRRNVTTKATLSDLLMINVKAGDIGAVIMGGTPVFYHYYSEAKNAGFTDQQAMNRAELMFGAASDRAQQASSEASKGAYFGSSNAGIGRTFFMYLTSPVQYQRNVNVSLMNLYKGLQAAHKGEKADMKQVAKEAARAVFVYHFLLPQIFQAVASGLTMFSDDDDVVELFWKRQLRALALGNINVFPAVGAALNGLANIGLDLNENFFGSSGSPLIDVTNEVTQDILRIADDPSAGNFYKVIEKAAQIGGIPAEQVRETGEAIYDISEGDTDFPVRRLLGWGSWALGED